MRRVKRGKEVKVVSQVCRLFFGFDCLFCVFECQHFCGPVAHNLLIDVN